MRDLSIYDRIYVDLDDTLVYGFMTDLMSITWKLFKCQTIATILATIQSKFRLYKTNDKLLYMLKKSNRPVTILTARKPLLATFELVQQIAPYATLVEMSSLHPYLDKIDYITEECKGNVILFDDNKYTRLNAIMNDILAIDPTPMFEEVIK